MSRKRDDGPKECDIVNKIVKDIAGDIVHIKGYVGKSSSPELVRLYLNLRFNTYIEFPKQSIIHYNQTKKESLPELTNIWISAETPISYTKPSQVKTQMKFLKGRIGRKYLPLARPVSRRRRAGGFVSEVICDTDFCEESVFKCPTQWCETVMCETPDCPVDSVAECETPECPSDWPC